MSKVTYLPNHPTLKNCFLQATRMDEDAIVSFVHGAKHKKMAAIETMVSRMLEQSTLQGIPAEDFKETISERFLRQSQMLKDVPVAGNAMVAQYHQMGEEISEYAARLAVTLRLQKQVYA